MDPSPRGPMGSVPWAKARARAPIGPLGLGPWAGAQRPDNRSSRVRCVQRSVVDAREPASEFSETDGRSYAAVATGCPLRWRARRLNLNLFSKIPSRCPETPKQTLNSKVNPKIYFCFLGFGRVKGISIVVVTFYRCHLSWRIPQSVLRNPKNVPVVILK